MRLAYADPPYPGLAARYYRNQPDYGGEVDHRSLVDSLVSYDGWALSTSARSLGDVLALCPSTVRVCAWVKPQRSNRSASGLCNSWEPLIVFPARREGLALADWLSASVARGGDSDLIGRKPLAFVCWMLRLLGARPCDSLDDLFPGSHVVSRVFAEFSSMSPQACNDTSLQPVRDVSLAADRDSIPS